MSSALETGHPSIWNAIVDACPLTASGQTRLAKVLALMAARPKATCILGTYRQKVVGIATRSDVLSALATSKDWHQIRLSSILTRPVITVSQSEDYKIYSLLEQCEQQQISHLPVVDNQNYLVGLIHKNTLLKHHTVNESNAQRQQNNQQSSQQPNPQPNQRAQLVAQITLKIRQSLQIKEILQTTVDEVMRLLQADRVLIYQVLPNGTGKAVSEAVAAPYPPILGMTFPEEVFPEEYQVRYAQGRVHSVADVHAPNSGLSECLVEFIEQLHIRSKLIVPIVNPMTAASAQSGSLSQHLWGLLIAHQCSGPRVWSDFEQDLMQQLAGQISLAFSQGQLLEYLEDRVRLRTAELTATNRSLQTEIQDRQLAEAALRNSEAQLRLITNHLPVLIAYVDSQQRYQFTNEVYQHWLGQSPANSYGASIEQVMGEAYYEKNHPYIEAVLAGKQVSYESELTFQDGRSHSVSVAYVPHIETNQAGKRQVKGFFALTTDISDRKAIERMKDEFIAVVSHELRTPLTSIHTSLKLLATGQLGSLSEDGQQMLEVADENTDRLVRLVNNVLDLQRIESGDVTLDTHACSGAQLLEQAAEAMTTMAQQHNIHLKTHTEPLSIWADPDYIIRTLTNLIGNAIKFSEPGTVIHLTVQSSPLQQSFAKPSKQQSNKQQSDEQKHPPSKAPQALFCVEDQGQGIPSDKLTQIFERFQQVDSSDSRKKGGTGLGLTICRKIIEQHGGRIWADSQIGVGSRFYFTVPLNPPTNLTPAASTKTERQAISIANSPSQLTYTEGL